MSDSNITRSDKHPDRGFFYRRTEDNCHHGRLERAFAEVWEEEAAPNPQRGSGSGLVQSLLITGQNPFSMFSGGTVVEKVTIRDRQLVATIIQWLGSNVGWCFLETALRRAGYKIVPIEKK